MIKKLFFLLFLLPTLAFGQGWDEARLNVGIVGGGVTAAGGCNPATNEIGDRNIEATAEYTAADAIYMYRAQADCTGTLETAYIYAGAVSGQSAKVCIYTSTDVSAPYTPQNADALVGCSGAITADGNIQWFTGSIGSGSVTKDAWYWILIIANAAGEWKSMRTNTDTLFYVGGQSAFYASPPATLNGISFSTATNIAPMSVYVRIQ